MDDETKAFIAEQVSAASQGLADSLGRRFGETIKSYETQRLFDGIGRSVLGDARMYLPGLLSSAKETVGRLPYLLDRGVKALERIADALDKVASNDGEAS